MGPDVEERDCSSNAYLSVLGVINFSRGNKVSHVERLPRFDSISLRLVPWTDESNPS